MPVTPPSIHDVSQSMSSLSSTEKYGEVVGPCCHVNHTAQPHFKMSCMQHSYSHCALVVCWAGWEATIKTKEAQRSKSKLAGTCTELEGCLSLLYRVAGCQSALCSSRSVVVVVASDVRQTERTPAAHRLLALHIRPRPVPRSQVAEQSNIHLLHSRAMSMPGTPGILCLLLERVLLEGTAAFSRAQLHLLLRLLWLHVC
jgi:hypothetical protein